MKRLLKHLLRQPQLSNDVWLVVGLGNPGPNYQSNRHNIGHMVLDEIAKEQSIRFKAHKSIAHVAMARLGGQKVVLLKSQGFMNLSGSPVQSLMTFYGVSAEKLIVVHDELDIPFGEIRTKFSGGHAGHNGLRDIIARIGNDFHRIRFGIGRPEGNQSVSDFVLSNFSPEEKPELAKLISTAIKQIDSLIGANPA